MSEETDNFQTKIVKLKDFLGTKGIILVTRPFIEECIIRGITLKKAPKDIYFYQICIILNPLFSLDFYMN